MLYQNQADGGDGVDQEDVSLTANMIIPISTISASTAASTNLLRLILIIMLLMRFSPTFKSSLIMPNLDLFWISLPV